MTDTSGPTGFETPAGHDRDFFRRQVLGMFEEADEEHLLRATVIGYLRGSVALREPEVHATATRGACDALDEALTALRRRRADRKTDERAGLR